MTSNENDKRQIKHLEWQEKWPCAHLCHFTEYFIVCLKKADSLSLNDTAGECLIHLFKHLAKFVMYLISTHLINPNEKVINIQQIYTGQVLQINQLDLVIVLKFLVKVDGLSD